jgi:DNA-binding beta-propeller fold protein YncE
MGPSSIRRRFPATLLATALLLLAACASASAADSVYWANYTGGKISFASLAGGDGADLDTTGANAENANGLAIDSKAGKVYWIVPGPGAGTIYYANLSGGGGGEISTAGAPAGFPIGLAVDPAGGRAYWTSGSNISYANLDGSGGGALDTTGATVEGPQAVAVDPATGRIYWANSGSGVSFASLAGGGGGDVATTGATVDNPSGVAVDSAAGIVYWSNYNGDAISYARLGGTGGGDVNTAGATVDGPFGIALDPAAGRIYWANEVGDSIAYANLDGSGGADLDTGAANLDAPAFPALLKAPSPVAAPKAIGGPKPGATLSCEPAGWAPDVFEAFLYRGPTSTSVQWLEDGQPIAGATGGSLVASSVGSYSCQSTAVNQAGSTAQTSAAVPVFRVGKAKVNRKKGTALLPVKVPGAGTVTLAGRKLVRQKRARSASSTGVVKLLVKAKGKAKKALGAKGKLRVKATVTFTPAGGSAASQKTAPLLKMQSR